MVALEWIEQHKGFPSPMLDGLVLGWWGSLGGSASNEDDELLDACTSTATIAP